MLAYEPKVPFWKRFGKLSFDWKASRLHSKQLPRSELYIYPGCQVPPTPSIAAWRREQEIHSFASGPDHIPEGQSKQIIAFYWLISTLREVLAYWKPIRVNVVTVTSWAWRVNSVKVLVDVASLWKNNWNLISIKASIKHCKHWRCNTNIGRKVESHLSVVKEKFNFNSFSPGCTPPLMGI